MASKASMEGSSSFMQKMIMSFGKGAKHASVIVFLLGFILDLFTLPRIDHPAVPYLVAGHMMVIGGSILLNRILLAKMGGRFERLETLFPLLTAFSFGAILSFLFIYFARSSAPGASWPFLLFLAAIMIGSEMFRKRLEGLRFYVTLFSVLTILLSTLFVPIVFGNLSTWTFVASVVLGSIISVLYAGLLYWVTPLETKLIFRGTVIAVSVFIALLVTSYFSGIMPAIPLVLKEGDVYRSVVRTPGGEYLREGNPRSWYTGLLAPRVHLWTPGTPVYFYSAVFAPTTLSGTVVHDWQIQDEKGAWISLSRISFPISGGREEGYRGYSYKEGISVGKWRVVVSLSDGRVIGRVPFTIQRIENIPD